MKNEQSNLEMSLLSNCFHLHCVRVTLIFKCCHLSPSQMGHLSQINLLLTTFMVHLGLLAPTVLLQPCRPAPPPLHPPACLHPHATELSPWLHALPSGAGVLLNAICHSLKARVRGRCLEIWGKTKRVKKR